MGKRGKDTAPTPVPPTGSVRPGITPVTASDPESAARIERNKVHTATLERVIGFTRVADAKAAPLIALQTTLAGLLLGQTKQIVALCADTSHAFSPYVVAGLVGIYVFSAVTSWIYAARVYVPLIPPAGGSLIYFEDIRAMARTDFKARSAGLGPTALEEALLDQIFRVSEIASRKFGWVRTSFQMGALAVLTWAVLLGWAIATARTK